MKRAALYSQSRPAVRSARPQQPPDEAGPAEAAPAPAAEAAAAPVRQPAAWRRFAARHDRPLLLAAAALLAVVVLLALQGRGPGPKALTQADIDKAVLHTLNTQALPSPAARAAEKVRPAVVRVRGVAPGERGDADLDEGVGSGVVIVDTGVILTNLHVVADAEKVVVEFFDGHESDAVVISVKPEHDLAVLQAKSLPDDLFPATLRATRWSRWDFPSVSARRYRPA
jgi:hypothetical protein